MSAQVQNQQEIPKGFQSSGQKDLFQGIARVRLQSLDVGEVTITPEMAARWLERNENFRAHSESRSRGLSEQMAQRLWDVNGETIKFDDRGNLKDGQHRLRACILSKTPFRSLVVWGISSDLGIDTGAARQLADVLHSRGEKNATVLSAAVRWMWRYEQGKLRNNVDTKASYVTFLDVLQRHPNLRQSVTATHAVKDLLAHSPAAFLHYVFTMKNADAGAKFFDDLATGANLPKSNAIYHLRRRLARDRDSQKEKLRMSEKVGLTIKAWNIWLRGKECGTLKITLSGPTPEQFPEIEGANV